MSIDLFRIAHGLEIQSSDLTTSAQILQGAGVPGGDAGVQDSAPIGSIYMRVDADIDNLQIFYKQGTNNTAADWKQVSSKDYVDAIAKGLSWRAPAKVLDDTLYASSAEFPTTGTIDGVLLSAGDRVLFTNVTNAADNNVWIWDGAAWTASTNVQTDGDAILIMEGSLAETQWVYDGTEWVQFGGAASHTELEFIRSFIGKSATGAESPTYSSAVVVTQAGSLEAAIGELDAAVGTNQSNISTLQTNVGTLQTDVGNLQTDVSNLQTDVGNLQAEVVALDATFSGTDVVASAGATVDTVALTVATNVKWVIQVRETATPANRRSMEIHALSDGVSAVDYTQYAILKLGAAIAGFGVAVEVVGTDLVLKVTATGNIDYVVKRVAATGW